MCWLYQLVVNLPHKWFWGTLSACVVAVARLYFRHGDFVGAWEEFIARRDSRIGNVLTNNRKPPERTQAGVTAWAKEMSLAEIAKEAKVGEKRVVSTMPRLVKAGIAIPCGEGRWKGCDKHN